MRPEYLDQSQLINALESGARESLVALASTGLPLAFGAWLVATIVFSHLPISRTTIRCRSARK